MSNIKYVISALVLFSAITSAGAQEVLKTDIQDFDTRRKFVYGLCGNMKVLCGWVVAEGDSTADFNEVRIKGTHTVENVLNTIITKNPKYHWIVEDGVVNIIPKTEFRHLVNGKDQLDTIVKNFKINNVTAKGAEYPLYKAARLNCPAREGGGFHPLREHYNRISLELDNVTLRTALNRIIAKSGGTASWKLEYSSIQNDAPLIDITCERPCDSFFPENPALKNETEQSTHKSYRNRLLLAAGVVIACFVLIWRRRSKTSHIPTT